MKTYIVQLEDHDDVISARDKISWSKARRILLVWPPEGRASSRHVLERRVDLQLLQRHSQQIGAQLALVTRSGIVKTHASELGIPVFPNAVEAQEVRWRTRKLRRFARKKLMRPATRQAEPRDLRAERQAARREMQEEWFNRAAEKRWVRLGAFTLGVLAFLLLVLSFAPGAEVILKPTRRLQQMTIAVWASQDIHTPNASGGLPAEIIAVTVEGRDQANSTGRSSIPEKYATGLVLLSNLTDQPVDVPPGSVVLGQASREVRFTTTQDVKVPAGPGKSVMVAVQAVQPGSAGNLSAGKIQSMQGPIGLRLTVNNPSPTSGGSDQVSRAPTSQDYAILRQKLLARLQNSAIEEMGARLKPDQRLLEGTIHVRSTMSETREPPDNQPADQLQLTMQVEFEAWTVNEGDLQAIAQTALDATREKGFQPATGSLKITIASEPRLEPADSSTNQTVRWNLNIERVLAASLSEGQVVGSIQGRGVAEARRTLEANLRLAEAPLIRLYPSWWGRLPFLPARIKLVTQ